MRRHTWNGIVLLLILLPMVAWAGVTTVDGGSPITSTVVFDRLHQLMTGAAYSATIVSDEVPGTTDDGSCAGRYEVTAEAGGVDDLASMDASGCQDGDLVILWAASGQTLTVKGDSTGNITLLNGQDFTLDTQTKFVLLQRNGTEFYGVGFHAGSAGLKAGDLVQYVLDDGVKPGGSQGISNIKATTYAIGTDDTRECYGGVIQVTATATINACPATVGVRFAVKAQGTGVVVTLEADNSGTPDTVRVNGVVPSDTDTIVAAGFPGDSIACWYYAADTLDCISAAGRTLDAIEFVIDGGGSAITTGIKGDLEIPWDATIQRVTVLCDQSGSIVVDLWVQDYASYPPTNTESITASAPPTVTTDTDSQDSTLTGWTVDLTEGQTIRYNVDSATTVTRCAVSLQVAR